MRNPLIYQLYLLQIEDYRISGYFRLLGERGFYFPQNKLRKSIVWTAKAKSIFAFSIALALLIFAVVLLASTIAAVFWALLALLFMPFIYILATLVIWPFDYFTKHFLITKAREHVASQSNLKIVGIAGSYGKTTMKNVIASTLCKKLNVISTPESVNTPVGISRWIIKNLKSDTQVMIVEMGEHYKGDISFLCSITPVDIAVITGVNEAHLERLKSIDNAIATIFEIAQDAKRDSLVLMNSDDKLVSANYKKFIGNKKSAFYTKSKNELAELRVENASFDEKELAWKFDLGELKGLASHILGEYSLGNIMAAVLVAKELGLDDQAIKQSIGDVKPIEHRLQPIKGASDMLVIDDSYNGNPDGADEAIKTLSRFNRRKIYLTPGLVEIGSKTKEVHLEIGRKLAKVANQVMLIKNSVTPLIADGLKEQKFPESDIIWFDSADEAHSSLGKYLKPGDVIVFQNDWSDEYV